MTKRNTVVLTLAANEKGKEGSCGEARCGANRKAADDGSAGDKTREVSCGANKAKEGTCGANKTGQGSSGADGGQG